MSLIAASQLTAIATAVLAAFAIVTAAFAYMAFRKQSTEVTTLQQQFDDQRKVNEKQTAVLDLQAKELQASLTARQEAAMQWRYQYASTVVAWQDEPQQSGPAFCVVAHVKNTGERPVRDMSARWHAAGAAIQDREQLTPCFLPGEAKTFECRFSRLLRRPGRRLRRRRSHPGQPARIPALARLGRDPPPAHYRPPDARPLRMRRPRDVLPRLH
jgi:hypothetical protein